MIKIAKCFFILCKRGGDILLLQCSPFLRCLFVLYKSVCRILLIRCAPSFPLGLFSHHSNKDNSLQDYPSFAGETVGTRIDRDNSFIMPLRLRGGYATECHAFSYCSSSSALIFSPPCGSHFEYAHCVYKNASNKCSFWSYGNTETITEKRKQNTCKKRRLTRRFCIYKTPIVQTC